MVFLWCKGTTTLLHSVIARPKAIHFSWLGPELFRLLLGPPGSTDDLLLLQISSGVVLQSRGLKLSHCIC